MAKPHPLELRERAVRLSRQAGMTILKVARLLDIGVATLTRWRKQERETGSLAPSPPHGSPPTKRTPELRDQVKALLEEKSDRTLDEVVALLLAQHQVAVSSSTVSRVIQELGWTRKKKLFKPPSGTRSASSGSGRSLNRPSRGLRSRHWCFSTSRG